MIWMPWYGKDTKDLETMIGNEYFDAVLIQSGIFFMEEYNEEKAKDRMTNTIKFVQRMRKEGGRTNVGLHAYEYDTSAYTGRVYMPEEDMKEHPYVTAGNKKALLNMYLRMINEARMQDGDMLIGFVFGRAKRARVQQPLLEQQSAQYR